MTHKTNAQELAQKAGLKIFDYNPGLNLQIKICYPHSKADAFHNASGSDILFRTTKWVEAVAFLEGWLSAVDYFQINEYFKGA